MPSARIALWGADHPDLGATAVEALDARTAIGLSAGRLPKSYWHLDPNEDAVLAMADGERRLLAVADGHNGADASHAALEAISAAAAGGLDGKAAAVLDGMAEAAAAGVRDRLAGGSTEREDSRTALTIAVIADGRVVAATWGDTTAVAIRRGRRTSLRPIADHGAFLGPRWSPPAISAEKVGSGDAVVLCSDGVRDYLGSRWREQIVESVTRREGARGVAEDLIERAALGGAGDHCAAAVALLP
jgi:serine/threonine protein phosphatase PrpC